MLKQLPLHQKILLGLVLGVAWGFLSNFFSLPEEVTTHYLKPVGTIFIRMLKMIAVPLVLASLIVGIANLNDIQKLSAMGSRTITIYLSTTVIALVVGLILVNLMQPGSAISEETRELIMSQHDASSNSKMAQINALQNHGPLTPIVNMVPTNIISAASDNRSMLQVVFLALMIGIACIKLPAQKTKIFLSFFEGLDAVTIKIIDFIMAFAPYGVFALLGSLIVELKNTDILLALLQYAVTVILGLLFMLLVVYPTVMKIYSKQSYFDFFKAIRPAQLLAFSTSSSSATLPVTLKQCEEELHISNEVAGFVLPIGATINMDGTSLYQGVAAVFIAQVVGIDLTLIDQITIVFTAVLASIGSAGVPGAGMIMLAIVLESVGIPVAYIALILAPDRLLDMCRTLVNVTGDAAVACCMNSIIEKKK